MEVNDCQILFKNTFREVKCKVFFQSSLKCLKGIECTWKGGRFERGHSKSTALRNHTEKSLDEDNTC